MCSFLSEHFKYDSSKDYYLIDAVTAERRKREEHPIAGCMAAHAISLYPDDTYGKWATVKDFMEDDQRVSVVENEQQEIDDEIELTYEGSIEIDDKYSIIDKNLFVAIHATPGHPEMFHLMKVEDKQIATENIMDSSGEHCVLKGEPYLKGKWYSFQKESKKFAWYKESKTELALIHIAEVLSTNLELNDKHQMDIFEYRMLASAYH